MTHTLHRRGTPDSLSRDYVVLCIAGMGVNDEGSEAKLREFIHICMRHDPKNLGFVKVGNMYTCSVDEIAAGVHGHAHAVFDSAATVTQVLRELKEADLGLSVVVSGLLDAVERCCIDAGLKRHTVELSLGIWGRVEKLESADILEVTTMCGHGLIAGTLVKSLVDGIRNGRKTSEGASRELAALCGCGVFNVQRARELLASMAGAAAVG